MDRCNVSIMMPTLLVVETVILFVCMISVIKVFAHKELDF